MRAPNAGLKAVAKRKAAGKRKPPRDQTAPATAEYNKHQDRMAGPNAPDPKAGNGVLPPKAAKNGAYFLPGFGDVARAKNRRRYRDSHAFNPGRNNGTRWS